MNPDLKRQVILEHYTNPINKGLIDDNKYIKVNMNNESCIDEVNLMVKVEDNIIKDIRFEGEACAISTSATSIMIETLLNKTVDEVKEIYNNYKNMIDEKEYNKDILENAIVYDDIYKQPSRKKCAMLSWWAMEKVIKEIEKNG
jgi:nitrogen fixation NifU-like protein